MNWHAENFAQAVFTHTLVFLIAGLSCSCETMPSKRHDEPIKATFGVFFGAQLQQRRDIPLVTDESKQRQGFRLEFSARQHKPVKIEWDLDFPAKRTGSRGPGSAVRGIRHGSTELPLGATEFEQPVTLLRSDCTGVWNLRVAVDGETVLDRPFRVIAPTSRGDDAP